MGALVAGYGAEAALGSEAGEPLGIAVVVLAAPVGAVAALYGSGHVVGARAPLPVIARDAALGLAGATALFLAGAGVGALADAAEGRETFDRNALLGGTIGAAAGFYIFGVVSTRSLRVAPAALAAPTGERATGLGFTLRL